MHDDSHETFIIRRATTDDAAALARLFTSLGYPVSAETLLERFRQFTAAGEHAFVAAHETRLLGAITVHATPVLHRPTAVARITALIVDDAARSRGVGRALVAAAESHLTERGCALIEVTSNERRTDAHAFYQRLGYERTSLRFAKPLPAAQPDR
jgi:ribosomal protein S18 acetylase RimI-like enzyme